MRRFREFLNESPNETEAVVPVSVYLHTPPDLDRPIDMLIVGVKANLYVSFVETVELASLTPTQKTVNNLKVMQYGRDALHDDRLPLVCEIDKTGRYYIVDGHHRICGAIVQGLTHLAVRIVLHQ